MVCYCADYVGETVVMEFSRPCTMPRASLSILLCQFQCCHSFACKWPKCCIVLVCCFLGTTFSRMLVYLSPLLSIVCVFGKLMHSSCNLLQSGIPNNASPLPGTTKNSIGTQCLN